MTDTSQFDASSASLRNELLQFRIPPAAELFPDTYNHAIHKALIYICILSPSQAPSIKIFEENADCVAKALQSCGYGTDKPMQRKIFHMRNELDEFLTSVEQMDFDDCSAVLLFWFGETDENGSNGMIALKSESLDIRDLWKPFVKEEMLLGKPKINMFFTYLPLPIQSSVVTDSCPMPTKPRDPYETPAEADVLIIYQKTDRKKQKDDSSYVKSFANNMIKLGQQYHISNLSFINTVMNPKQGLHYPIVVSTLVSKFFIQSSQHRGIHLELDELTNGIHLNLNNMMHAANKKAAITRRSTITAPAMARRQSKDIILTRISLPQNCSPDKTAKSVLQKPVQTGRPSLPRRKEKMDYAVPSTSSILKSDSKNKTNSTINSSQFATTARTTSQKTTPSRSRLSSLSKPSTPKPIWRNK